MVEKALYVLELIVRLLKNLDLIKTTFRWSGQGAQTARRAAHARLQCKQNKKITGNQLATLYKKICFVHATGQSQYH